MKNETILVILVVLLLHGAAAIDRYVQLENVDVPTHVYPGDIVTLRFDVRNIFNSDLKYVYVKISPQTNFKVVGSDTWAHGSLSANEKATASFTIKVDENALAGVYAFPITINSEAKTLAASTSSGGVVTTLLGFSQADSVNLQVDGLPNIVTSVVGVTPYLIDPGQQATATLKLYNNGSDTARNVRLQVSSFPGITISSGSENIFIGDIAPKSSASAAVSFEVDSEAESKNYRLPVTIAYDGAVIQFTADIKVREAAKLEITNVLYDGGLLIDKTDQPIQLTIKNTGNRKAEDVSFILVAEYPFTPTGRSNFLTTLAPGEEKTIGFSISVDSKAVSQTYPAQAMITWREGERSKSSIRGFSLLVQPARPSNYYLLAAGVAVAALVFALVLKRKKR